MNDRIEAAEMTAPTVSVWTPWGEQKVVRSDSRAALLRRAAKRLRSQDESGLTQNLSDQVLAGG